MKPWMVHVPSTCHILLEFWKKSEFSALIWFYLCGDMVKEFTWCTGSLGYSKGIDLIIKELICEGTLL